MNSTRTPVTILTGFLGAGKTTLLNRLLGENPQTRFAVIENEFGDIPIDGALISDEDAIVELTNVCICCTVRGDLQDALQRLMARRTEFDHLLIETTGLADPSPVAQELLHDPARAHYRLDGIITLLDALQHESQLGHSAVARAQLRSATLIVLNKIDLLPKDEWAALGELWDATVVSAVSGEGLTALMEQLERAMWREDRRDLKPEFRKNEERWLGEESEE